MRWNVLKASLAACSLFALTSLKPSSSTPVSAESEYSTLSIAKGTHYRIESDGSDGAAFYISFGKASEDNETARFSYIFDEISLQDSELGNAGVFVSNKTDVASSYDKGQKISFKDGVADPGFMLKTNVFYSLLFYKAPGSSTSTAIIRNNVHDYGQAGAGDFEDTEGLNGVYGYYFDGANVTLSFLTTFTFGTDFTLHYQSGVKVTVDEKVITATLDAEDYEILSKEDGDVGGQAIYNSSLTFIPLTKKDDPEDTRVEFDHIEVNGVENESLSLTSDGVRYYLIAKLSDNDTVKIVTKKTIMHEDKNVQVHDLLEVSGVTEMKFTELENAFLGVGNIPNEANHAFRFVLNTPKLASGQWNGEKQTKFGMWTSNNNLWSNFGYIIRFREGMVDILSGEEANLGHGESNLIKPSSALAVVIGLAKVTNESGVWYANRIYVEVNDVRVAYYDDTERKSLGSVITAPYLGEKGAEVSFEDYRKADLLPVSDLSNDPHVRITHPSYIQKGEDLDLTFVLDEGYKFLALSINGVDALSNLVYKDGVYSLKESGITSAVGISYSLISDVRVCLSVEGDLINASYEANPLYGSRSVVKFNMPVGKIPSSVLIDEVESVSSLERSGNVFSLKLNPLIENVKVVVKGEDKSFAITSSLSEDSHASVSLDSSSVLAGGSTAFSVNLEEGYVLEDISITGDATFSSSSGVYFLDDVYGDVAISLKTRKEASAVVPAASPSFPWVAIMLYCVAGAALIGGGLAIGLVLKKKKEN